MASCCARLSVDKSMRLYEGFISCSLAMFGDVPFIDKIDHALHCLDAWKSAVSFNLAGVLVETRKVTRSKPMIFHSEIYKGKPLST